MRGAKGYVFVPAPAASIDLVKSSTAPHAPSSILHPYLANLGAITTCLRVSLGKEIPLGEEVEDSLVLDLPVHPGVGPREGEEPQQAPSPVSRARQQQEVHPPLRDDQQQQPRGDPLIVVSSSFSI